MATTYQEHMEANPEQIITEARSLAHEMEYEDFSGWERCNNCGHYENEMDDVGPASDVAVDGFGEWEDYEEHENGQRRLYYEQEIRDR